MSRMGVGLSRISATRASTPTLFPPAQEARAVPEVEVVHQRVMQTDRSALPNQVEDPALQIGSIATVPTSPAHIATTVAVAHVSMDATPPAQVEAVRAHQRRQLRRLLRRIVICSVRERRFHSLMARH